MVEQRLLTFTGYADIIKEIENLKKKGYRKGGSWTLGQVCRHISYYYRGSLDGFARMLPWILRATVGKMMLKKYISGERRKPGGATAPDSVYPPDADDTEGIREALELLKRLEANRGPLHPSALFGEMTEDQWLKMHCAHSAHHLGFLIPNE